MFANDDILRMLPTARLSKQFFSILTMNICGKKICGITLNGFFLTKREPRKF